MTKQYAVSPINNDGSHDADAFRSRSRAAAEREARKVARSGRFVAATVVECRTDAEGDLICREAVAAVGDARALDAAGYADLPRLADDARKVHKVEPTPPTTPTPRPTVEERVRADARVAEVSDERALGDGIFLSLARGLRFDGDGLHIVHEPSWSACARALREVRPCACDDCTTPTTPTPTTPTTDDAAQTSTASREAAERDAHAARLGRDRLDDALAEVETPRALWLAEADDLDRLPSLGSWLARDWYERARCIVVSPSRDWRGLDSWLVVRGQERRLALGGPFVIADMPTVDPADERADCGRAQRLGSALHLACVAAAEARDAQGRAAAVVVVSGGQVRDLGRDADAAVQAYAQSLAAWSHDRAASGVAWEFDPHPARRFWAALGATA